jgi:hypothetical protein
MKFKFKKKTILTQSSKLFHNNILKLDLFKEN